MGVHTFILKRYVKMTAFNLHESMKPLAISVFSIFSGRKNSLDPDRVHSTLSVLGEDVYFALNEEERFIAQNLLVLMLRTKYGSGWMFIRGIDHEFYFVNIENGLSPLLLSRMEAIEEG